MKAFVLLCIGVALLGILVSIERAPEVTQAEVDYVNQLMRSGKLDYDVQGARAAGISDAEIVDYIVNKRTKR